MMEEVTENLVILLAEDDKGHAALVKKNLWRICIEARIVHFSTGEELLAYLDGQAQKGEAFKEGRHVILLDIKMPGIDGIETLRLIKTSSNLKKIPVIMLTTTNDPSEIFRCYQHGCAFYIVKPSDYNKFMDSIEHLGAFLSLPSLVIPDVEH